MELILVLTLLAIISSAIVPVFSRSLVSIHGKHSQREIIALLKYAQERAITDTVNYRFYCDPELNQYWLMRLDDQNGNRVFVEVTDKTGMRKTLPGNVKIEPKSLYRDKFLKAYFLEFYPSGASDRGELTLTTDDGETIDISTEGHAGQIEVDDK